MKIAFVSNFLSHHQAPFCDAMNKREDVEFVFVSTVAMDDERSQLGWESNLRDYEIRSYLSKTEKRKARTAINSADVVIIGSAPDRLIEKRLKKGKLTFKYAERFYKNGTPRTRAVRDAIAAWLHHGRFQKTPLYMLCASAYTAVDAMRFGNYKGRCYKWGYFPETKRYDIGELMQKKSGEKIRILWAGRFLDWKHPEEAVKAAELLKKEGYDFELSMIGTGIIENEIHSLVSENGLEENVHFLGAMPPEKVREHMEKANIFLFTSDRNEGWGAVLNEAMNSGCAVVASHAIGAVPFLIKDGENGLVYYSGNAEMLYEKIKHLLDNPNKTALLGEEAYKTISEKWNAEIAAERFAELSKRILNCGKDLLADGICSAAQSIDEGWL